jgi:hypothetical protein
LVVVEMDLFYREDQIIMELVVPIPHFHPLLLLVVVVAEHLSQIVIKMDFQEVLVVEGEDVIPDLHHFQEQAEVLEIRHHFLHHKEITDPVPIQQEEQETVAVVLVVQDLLLPPILQAVVMEGQEELVLQFLLQALLLIMQVVVEQVLLIQELVELVELVEEVLVEEDILE